VIRNWDRAENRPIKRGRGEKYPEHLWIDVAFGGVRNRNNLIKQSELRQYVRAWEETHKKDYIDCYTTYFRYSQEMLEHFKKKNTVSGYTGSCYSGFLPIDVDSQDLVNSLQTTKEILLYWESEIDIDVKTIPIYFSGSKGFHIEPPSELFGFEPSPNLHNIFRSLVKRLLPDGIVIDAAIYDKVRLWRLPNTVNSKSGLCKIPLSVDELFNLTIPEIQGLAKQPRRGEFYDLGVSFNTALHELYVEVREEIQKGDYRNQDEKKYHDLFNDGVIYEGEGRNNALFGYGCKLQAHRIPHEEIAVILQSLNESKCKPQLDCREFESILESIHRYDTHEGSSLKPISARELKDCEPVQTLWGETLYPESITQLNSEPGVGKTTFLYNLCLHGALNKDFLEISFSHALKILYVDVETPLWKRANKLKAISETLPENLFFLDTLDLKRNFPDLLTLCETEKYDLLVFDTQSRIFGMEQENDNAEANHIIELLRQLTKKTKCAIVLIHHTSKSETTKKVYRGRGASAVAGAVDVVVNMEALDNEVIKLTVSKNRIVGDYPVLFLTKAGEDKFEPYTPADGNSGFEIFKAQRFILSLETERHWQTYEISELGTAKGFNKRTVERALGLLVQTGKAQRIKKGVYAIRRSATSDSSDNSATYKHGGTVGLADSGYQEDFPEVIRE
jgi:RecA-family ATPase